ncbi:MAG: DUF1800 family protein [Methylocystis sp.]
MAPGPDPYAAMTAFNRFGYGAKPGDLALAASDPRGFLLEEIRAKGAGMIAADGLSSTPRALQMFFAEQQQLRIARETAAAMAAPLAMASANAGQMEAKPADNKPADPKPMEAKPMEAKPAEAKPKPQEPPVEQKLFRAEALARFVAQMKAGSGFVERLVAFWSNHFAVSVVKGQYSRATAGSFEREAIRPHVLGKFADLLIAVESHPAMIFYLDNQRSIGPGSNAGRFDGKGLNENLAREILELHTLGVGGGYAQSDVTALARIITGWSFGEPGGDVGEPGAFLFKSNWHEPGVHNLLGRNYPQTGRAQGEEALRDLARHPSTARHIATKLAKHFVADAPPPELVDALTKAFRDSDGDLVIVTAALIENDHAWSAPPTKIRSPAEFAIAAKRATSNMPTDANQVLGVLNSLGMPLWQPPGPNGYSDAAAVWGSPEQMKLRLDVSWQMAQGARDYGAPLGVLDTVCGLAASRETREALLHAESRPQALALLFMSPEFQRR